MIGGRTRRRGQRRWGGWRTVLVAASLVMPAVLGGPAGAAPATAAEPLAVQELRGAEVDPHTVLVRFAGTNRFVEVATRGRRPRDVAAELRRDPSVAAVELNVVRRALQAPNDPRYTDGSQAHLGPLRLERAWDVTHGAADLVIAVVDSGVTVTHPDLAGRTLPGYDFVDDDLIPQDDLGHGTEVAGVAAAATDNATGIAGVAWNALILPVRVLDANGSGNDADVAAGIRWATDNGADVINLSLGGYGTTETLRLAVAYAIAHGVVVVAAAGNLSGATVFKEPVYPASYPDVIGVSATDDSGQSVSWTLHGPWVDVAAPGSAVLTTDATTPLGYGQPSGTSFSAPLVAGVAALLRAKEPALTPAAVGDRLRSTAHDAGLPGRDDVYGSGIVDAAAALGAEPTQPPRPPATGDAYEPNDAPAAAAPIATGTISATIAPEGEVDRYRLSVPEYTRTTVRIDAPVDGGETTGVDPILTVLGPSGAVVAARDTTGSGGSETAVFDTATAGTYTVVVENFLPTLGTGPYRLAVSTADLPRPATTTTTSTTTTAPPAPAPAPPPRSGYWMVGRDGTVYGFGDAQNFGSIAGLPRAMEAVDLEPTPTLRGYWVVTDTGHVYAFGDAPHLGALNGALTSGERVTSISATPSGRGYWLFTTRGRVVGYGDAPFVGDMAGVRLNGAVLDSIPTPTGRGYYMVGSDGGIFTFGDAVFEGSMGGVPLNAPVQSLVPDADGGGYWLVASDGGIFSFEAPFRGSMGDVRLNGPITGMVRFGNGYLMVGTDGGIFTFTDKEFYGSLGANPPPAPITAVAVAEG